MRRTFRTRIEDIVSVYAKARFERRARELGYSSRTWGILALLAGAVAVVLFAGAAGFAAVTAKQLYLNAYGVETTGKVVDVMYRTNHFGRKTRWETVLYEFTTLHGETIEGKLDRPAGELKNLPERDHFSIAYWERFPTVSSPRGVQTNDSVFLAPLFLLFAAHFALWSKRMIDWRADNRRLS